MASRSVVKPEGILKDIVVTIDSWEYPTYFIILYPKKNIGGYPLILRHPWLATAYAYIECHFENMTISQRESIKKLTLYPRAKSILVIEEPLWIPPDDGSDYYSKIIKPIITIEHTLMLKKPSKDEMISNFLQNIYLAIVKIRE
jgi:hypothetical protein